MLKNSRPEPHRDELQVGQICPKEDTGGRTGLKPRVTLTTLPAMEPVA